MKDTETSLLIERLETRLLMLNTDKLPESSMTALLADMGACIVLIGRKVTEKDNDSDLSRTILVWFADKVLPGLVSAMIMAAIGWFALVNGLLHP